MGTNKGEVGTGKFFGNSQHYDGANKFRLKIVKVKPLIMNSEQELIDVLWDEIKEIIPSKYEKMGYQPDYKLVDINLADHKPRTDNNYSGDIGKHIANAARLIEILSVLEVRLGFEMDDSEMFSLKTLGEVTDCIKAKIGLASPN